jgi:phage shock protein PspC (stress-responsive transcriptional regulator)
MSLTMILVPYLKRAFVIGGLGVYIGLERWPIQIYFVRTVGIHG